MAEQATAPTGGCDGAWELSADKVLNRLGSNSETGLSSAEAIRRRATLGPNQLRAAGRRRAIVILLEQFQSVVILLLLAAGILALAIGDTLEGFAVFFVIAVNAGIGFLTEWRAVRSMEALRRLGQVSTVVLRDSRMQSIPAEELVPGDIVFREGGDVVTADIRLIDAPKLQADESTLTGESMPVSKNPDILPAKTPLVERCNMLFKGTAVTRGSAKGVVVQTGLQTELGRISELVTVAEPQQTPLEKRLDALGQRLVWAVLLLAVLIAAAGVIAGRETLLAIEVAIALAVAAIPEGLPIVATIALARGMWRMARKKALIARLSAVETLGATSVILSDKTGTLTENRMTVTAICLDDGEVPGDDGGDSPPADVPQYLRELLRCASLCSNASIERADDGRLVAIGDPTEVALLLAAEQRGISRAAELQAFPEEREHAFDTESKMMATVHRCDGHKLIAVKGAPEAVLPVCTSVCGAAGERPLTAQDRESWRARTDALGQRGLRTLAIAERQAGSDAGEAGTGPYHDLVLLGVVGIEDPPRAGVGDAIRRCRAAGISVLMVTGDHAATAAKIAAEVGIVDEPAGEEPVDNTSTRDRRFLDSGQIDAFLQDEAAASHARVFSRVTPEQKLNLIDFYQGRDQVVAMTGDGVNDAPALKKADIGVAMGVRGTAVAREAAAMVLQDDEFGTIVDAVEQGRAIYENIRKFVVYLLSCNISEVLIVGIATLAGAPLPLLPLQILFLNLVTDVFPALALGVGEGSPGLMREKPRPFDEPVLTRTHWLRIVLHGLVIALTVLAAMAIALRYLEFSADKAVTVSFCTLALAQVWHVFNMRRSMSQVLLNEITKNPWVWAAVLLCVGLLLLAVYLPFSARVLQLSDPGLDGWALVVGMSLVPLLVAPLIRALTPRSQTQP